MSKKYNFYLCEHIVAVNKAAYWMVEHLRSVQRLPDEQRDDFLLNANEHDRSKYELVEYMPYDVYFYGEPDEDAFYGTPDKDAFNVAWLHHIHHNSHHWQHWVLINDDGHFGDEGKIIALEMPKQYVLEMVADWWSFSWMSGNLYEVFDWYEANRDNMTLHPKTREFAEQVLGEIRDALEAEGK